MPNYTNRALAKRVKRLEASQNKKKKGFVTTNRTALSFGTLYNIGAANDHVFGDINAQGGFSSGREGPKAFVKGMRLTMLIRNATDQGGDYTTDNRNEFMHIKIMIVEKGDNLVADGAEWHDGFGNAEVYGFFGTSLHILSGIPNHPASRIVWSRTVKVGGLGDRNDSGAKLVDYYIKFNKVFTWNDEATAAYQDIMPNYRLLFWAQSDNGSLLDKYSISSQRIVYFQA